MFSIFSTVILSWPTYPLSLARRGGSVHPLITSPSLKGELLAIRECKCNTISDFSAPNLLWGIVSNNV